MKRLSRTSLVIVPTALALACANALCAEVDPGLRERAAQAGRADALIVLSAKAPKSLLRTGGDYLERRRALVDTLRATADVSQSDLRRWLDTHGIAYRPFWIVNMIHAELTRAQIDALAARGDVARLVSNSEIALQRPANEPDAQPMPQPDAMLAIEWGVNKVRAPQVWAAGYTGQGIVIAGQDTGVRWTHAAIKAKYRGWNGSAADHNYNWHDAVHATGSSCGADSAVPCDDNGHGSHTIGTMLGDDGGTNQVGVAPGAKWIGCRNMNAGNGTPATYNECAEFFLAPTDLAGANPDPDRAPDVIGNSWGCPASEGCTAGDEVREAIENLVDGGIVFVAAAGNSGSACSTIFDAPATYEAAFTIGSRLGGRLAGLALMLLAAIDPLFVRQSRTLQAETPSLAFSLVAVAAVLAWSDHPGGRRGRVLAVVCGAALACSIPRRAVCGPSQNTNGRVAISRPFSVRW